jgi:hypothetical protein
MPRERSVCSLTGEDGNGRRASRWVTDASRGGLGSSGPSADSVNVIDENQAELRLDMLESVEL